MAAPKSKTWSGPPAPRRGRPPLPRGEARVELTMQRVAPETLATLKLLAPNHGGIGRVIDAAVAAFSTQVFR